MKKEMRVRAWGDQEISTGLPGRSIHCYLVCGPQLRSFRIKEMFGVLGEMLPKFPQKP